ncbi:MAG TPA: peptidylprolyl isomerase [Micromonosporaceae bacterium]
MTPVASMSRTLLAGSRWLILVVAVAVFVAGIVLLFQRPQVPPTDVAQEVIATVDGDPIYGVEVGQHVRPQPPWLGPNRPLDAVDSALRDAIIVRLLAAEARRTGVVAKRGPRAVVAASLATGLVDRELAARGITAESLTKADVLTFFEGNRDRLAHFRGARVSAIVLTDRRLAETLVETAATATDEQFRQLVRQHSTDAASRAADGFLAEVDEAPQEIPLAVARIVVATRHDGDVGLADTADGRFWVVRVTDVRLDTEKWSADVARRVRQLLFHEKRGEVIAELEAKLKPLATIEINQEALARFRERALDSVPDTGS